MNTLNFKLMQYQSTLNLVKTVSVV